VEEEEEESTTISSAFYAPISFHQTSEAEWGVGDGHWMGDE